MLVTNQTDTKITERHAVIVDWNGIKPGSSYYRKLHKLAGHARGKDGASILTANTQRIEYGKLKWGEKREIDWQDDIDKGVIIQEGVIITSSPSLARLLHNYIKWTVIPNHPQVQSGEKHPVVFLAVMDIADISSMTQLDKDVMKRLQNTLGKRGKRPDEIDYVVICHEQMREYNTKQPKGMVMSCPSCGGVNVNYREGHTTAYNDNGADIFDLWVNTRFANGLWSPAQIVGADWHQKAIDSAKPVPQVNQDTIDTRGQWLVDALFDNQELGAIVRDIANNDGRQQAIDVLDAIYSARRYHENDAVMMARVKAVQEYAMKGGNMIGISIAPLPTLDIIDISLQLGADLACSYMAHYIHNNNINGGK